MRVVISGAMSLLLLCLLLSGCGGKATVDVEATVQAALEATLTAQPTDTPVPPTDTAAPSNTPTPTNTSTPTPTPTATNTPTPMHTFTPTNTPTPTSTPTDTPTPTPSPPYRAKRVSSDTGVHYQVIEAETGRVTLTTWAQFSTPNDVKAGLFSSDWKTFAAAYHYGHEGGYTWIGVWSTETGGFLYSRRESGWTTSLGGVFD
jgi:hypothetical protein